MKNTLSISENHNPAQNLRKRKMLTSIAYISLSSLLLMGCDMLPKEEKTAEQIVSETSPDQIPGDTGNRNIATDDFGATPMQERVAIIGLLNKRTGKSRDIRINPGQSLRFGNVVVKVQACERTAPWETYPDIGAFTQLFVKERPPGTNDSIRWRKVFSGWLNKNNPAQNVVEHALYDAWVKDCIMLFPGETEPPFNDTSAPTDPEASDDSSSASSAPQSPTPRAVRTEAEAEPEPAVPSEEESEPSAPAPSPAPTAPPVDATEPEPAPEAEPSAPEAPEQSLDDLVDSALEDG